MTDYHCCVSIVDDACLECRLYCRDIKKEDVPEIVCPRGQTPKIKEWKMY